MSSLDDSGLQDGQPGAGGERVYSLDDVGEPGDVFSKLEALTRRASRRAAEWGTPAAESAATPTATPAAAPQAASPLAATPRQTAPAQPQPQPTAQPQAPAQAPAPRRQAPAQAPATPSPASRRGAEPVPVLHPQPGQAAADAAFAAQVESPEVERVVQQRDQQRLRVGLETSMDRTLRDCLRLIIERDGSDLHVGTGVAPSFRIDGDLVHLPEHGGAWSHDRMHEAVKSIVTPEEFKQLVDEYELDIGIDYDENYRFRVNLSFDRLGVAGVFRLIPNEVKSLRQLNMPESLYKLADMPRGLVLVTGPTGSGKSTTLAAMIDRVNENRACHILTIEDPIEYVHRPKKAVVNQREVGRDTKSFNEALRRALRQDPDVILVGELRDHETIQVALTAAETGHLVLSTLHTQDSVQTVDRIIDVFPAAQQGQIRTQLAGTLRGVVSQTLLKRVGGGRVAASEILLGTSAVANMIREGKTHLLYSALQAGAQYGMHTLDQNLAELVGTGAVDRAEAEMYVKDPQAFRSLRNRISSY